MAKPEIDDEDNQEEERNRITEPVKVDDMAGFKSSGFKSAFKPAAPIIPEPSQGDIDGAPLDEDADVDGAPLDEDVDGAPLEGDEDLDGEELEEVGIDGEALDLDGQPMELDGVDGEAI
jgi:U2-associated protein SR140